VAVLRSDPTVGLSVPRLLNEDGTLQHSVHRFPSVAHAVVMGFVPHRLRSGRIGRQHWLEGYNDHTSAADVDWVVGAVHCIRRAALGRSNPYSDRWFMYAEDLEICWHVEQRGWRVRFEPSAVVTHIGNVAGDRTFGALREERWIDAVYDWYVAERGPSAARMFAMASTAGLLAKAAVLRVTRRAADDQRSIAVEGLLRIHARACSILAAQA
jgi:GT2 family glycosyltransferase